MQHGYIEHGYIEHGYIKDSYIEDGDTGHAGLANRGAGRGVRSWIT
jgi:hypothetical protein